MIGIRQVVVYLYQKYKHDVCAITEKYLEFARECIANENNYNTRPGFNSVKGEMKIRDSLHKKNVQTAEY